MMCPFSQVCLGRLVVAHDENGVRLPELLPFAALAQPHHEKCAEGGRRVERGTDLFGFSVNLLFLRFSLSFYSVTSLRNKAGKSKFYQQKKSQVHSAEYKPSKNGRLINVAQRPL